MWKGILAILLILIAMTNPDILVMGLIVSYLVWLTFFKNKR